MITLDFEKAFDQLEMSAIKGVLEYFNFGTKCIRWFVMSFNQFESCIINAGYISEWFSPTRGLHQGAPESRIIFVCVVVVLDQQIRQNHRIKVIMAGEIEIKLSQFADDTTPFSLFETESMQEIINNLTVFEKNSGLKLIYDKSVCIVLAIQGTQTPSCTQRKS